ncbi:MAG: phage minor capsid protein, partial [Clostridiales bacterium]|nr:phage minor capsid protein [Clostridiales bacterium]
FLRWKKLNNEFSDNGSQNTVIQQNQLILRDESMPLEERNAEYISIREEEERRLNAVYDFNSIKGIENIPVPCKEVNGDSITGRVEYYLRGTCFYKHWKSGDTDLALACLYKAQELMFISDIIWKRSDFLRLVQYLYMTGRQSEAEIEQKRIDDFFKKRDIHLESNLRALEDASYLETDFVQVSASAPYCGVCAKYVNRIFSISGKDKRLPRLPEEFFSTGQGHHFKCLRVSPFVLGVTQPLFECADLIEYSNRTFIDERSYMEAQKYTDWRNEADERERKEAKSQVDMIENAEKYKVDMEKLKWLQANLPTLCPKSLRGFRQMRTINSKNYQKLVGEARKLGKEI